MSTQAREALVQERLSYTPDETSPLNRQGTVILTNAHAKQLRKVAAETKSRKQEEKENNEELKEKERLKRKYRYENRLSEYDMCTLQLHQLTT